MRKRLAVGAALAALLVAGVVWRLFYDAGPAAQGVRRIDLAVVRAEAARLPGPGPERIEVEILSHDAVPRIAMVAGSDWNEVDLVRASYRLISLRGSVVVDAGEDEANARAFGVDRFDRGARERVLRAMDGASAIVVTHEHGDHLGGALTSPRLAALLPKLRLTPEQIAGSAADWPAALRDRPAPFTYQAMRAVAPGVVLVKAPGHTPGSQMIFVRRSDGREFLFLGDTASMIDNVRLGHQRSRLVTRFMSGDDRAAVAALLQGLRETSRANPALVMVPGHDGPFIKALIRRGLLVRGFRR